MKFRLILVGVLMVVLNVKSSANEGLDISYKVPLLPLEIVFDSDGISFHGTKTIVTPLGSFSLGYSKYASKFDEDYTYVIIEDMNVKKEHIYKIKDKKKLKLVSEGRTEITVTKNRVRIVLEKGSRFKVSFSVEGEELSQRSSQTQWIKPSNHICKKYDGKVDSDGCEANWKDAKSICSASGGSLPSIEALRKVVIDCGGEMQEDNSAEWERNRNNASYQSCYKEKGFTRWWYWSKTEKGSGSAWVVHFHRGNDDWGNLTSTDYVLCVSGQ